MGLKYWSLKSPSVDLLLGFCSTSVEKIRTNEDCRQVFKWFCLFFCLGKKGRRKARKTDASDLTPNPQKLHNIGEQLQKLNAAIDGMGPVNDLPAVARARSRKEKNKLASRYQTEFECPSSYIQHAESEPRRRFPIDLSAKSGLFERFSVVVNAKKKLSCRALWFVVCRWTFGFCRSVFRYEMHLDIWPFNTYWRTQRIHWGKTSTCGGIGGLLDLTVCKMSGFCCLTFLFVWKCWILGLSTQCTLLDATFCQAIVWEDVTSVRSQ